jgi:hypothetical protein
MDTIDNTGLEEDGHLVQQLIAIISFAMAAVGGLAAMLSASRERQTMGSIVGIAFLLSFFINVDNDSRLILQGACLVAFSIAVLGGMLTIFTREGDRRTGAVVTGIVALGTALLILFSYLQVPLP